MVVPALVVTDLKYLFVHIFIVSLLLLIVVAMSLACFVQPQLVRILDADLNPIDVWMVEFPYWLAKYLCDLKAQNSYQQVAATIPCLQLSTRFVFTQFNFLFLDFHVANLAFTKTESKWFSNKDICVVDKKEYNTDFLMAFDQLFNFFFFLSYSQHSN